MGDRDPHAHAWPSFGWNDDPHDAHHHHEGDHDPYDARDARNLADQLVELLRAHHPADLEWALRIVLGVDSFSFGVSAGLVFKLVRNAAGVVDLVQVFALAEVHEHLFLHAGHSLRSALPFVAGSSAGRAAINAVDDAFGLRDAAKDAHKQREAILAALDELLTDPIAVADCFAESERASFVERWHRVVELRASRRLHDHFEAGVIVGELLAELLLLLATAATTARLTSKLPQLVRWAARVRTASGAVEGAGLVGEMTAPKPLQQVAAGPDLELIPKPVTPPEPAPPRASALEPSMTAPAPLAPALTAAPPLTKADGRTMLREAVSNLKKIPPEARETQFRSYREDISAATNGQWSAKHWPLTKNGSVYAGEGGEALVFDDAGNMYRGQLKDKAAFAREPGGLLIDYSKLKPL